MEKLIELLNEYEKSWLNEFELEKYEEWWYCEWNWRIFKGNWENNNELTPYELCSKQYWFIKRLVKHFMFNMTKIDARIALSDFNATDRMLMALAISEDPITLLIDCLE